MSVAVLFPDVDRADALQFSAPRRLNNGALRVDLKYKKDFDQEPIYQSCNLRRGFIKEFADEKTGRKSIKFECSLNGHDNPYSDVHSFVNGWKEVETRVVDMAKKSAKDWFKKPITDSQIDDYFNSAIRPSSDPEKWAPTFKLTVPQDKEGKPAVEVYDDQENLVTWDKFEEALKDCEFACIFKAPSIYFLPKMFGLTMQLQSVQFFPNRKLSGFAFRKRERGDSGADEPDAKIPHIGDAPVEVTKEEAAAFL